MAVTRMAGKDSDLVKAWAEFKRSEAFLGSVRAVIGADPKQIEGAMWAAFVAGYGGSGGTVTETTPT